MSLVHLVGRMFRPERKSARKQCEVRAAVERLCLWFTNRFHRLQKTSKRRARDRKDAGQITQQTTIRAWLSKRQSSMVGTRAGNINKLGINRSIIIPDKSFEKCRQSQANAIRIAKGWRGLFPGHTHTATSSNGREHGRCRGQLAARS